MTRLEAEVRRLFTAPAPQVRALVLQAPWAALQRAWQGVQADLHLPAPAIAVDGRGACQLWFALEQAVTLNEASAFLEGLARRYLTGVAPESVVSWPRADAALPEAIPPAAAGPERWSAFVAPDLAPLFADEPWLDHPPGADAQADLLSRIGLIDADAFVRAKGQLAPATNTDTQASTAAKPPDTNDPRSFLLSVMQDPAVDLRLRIEAARALLHAPRDGAA